jgi:Zn-dependent protease
MQPDDIDTLGWIGFAVILLLSLSVHEAAHAFVADRLGDPTARQLGRVTLNPLKHLHPVFSFLLPLLLWWVGGPIVGGGRPVPINVHNFKHKARDFMLVALAGPFSNLALVVVFGGLFVVASWTGLIEPMVVRNPYGPDNVFHASFLDGVSSSHIEMWLKLGALLNLGLALFNLIPIPPLDGSRVIGWLLPRSVQFRWYALDRLGVFLILGLMWLSGSSEHSGGGVMIYFLRALEWGYTNLGVVVDRLVGVVAA